MAASWTLRAARRTGCLTTRRNCSRITLFDQSERMLAEARTKATRLGIVDRCTFVPGDFFEHDFGQHAYDTTLVGFFLSHLTEDQERRLFDALRTMLDSSGRFLILDSRGALSGRSSMPSWNVSRGC